MHQIWIVAGPNGSGKTTLARRHLVDRLPVVNPDEIARTLNPSNPNDPAAAIRAGRQALALRGHLLADRRSFAIETTLSGNQELALMRDAKAAGYKVNLIFIATESPIVSMGRIASRVSDGGHRVSGADVERRYRRSMDNLPQALALADRAWLLDNSRARMRLIAAIEHNQVKSQASTLPRWVRGAKLQVLETGLSL
ncbi:zeta toxin family protein [Paramagnetospirillum marisnigri]|uniref:Zeta toxin family protein n=1 Tax=Paramagnetospirillum marisnigri TaxID=1285242 RepID=A0A178MP89_9PROT|nr:AAA family ATPase [Paramagnetospirillum marisnigri]OAN50526.1 zeta toxin family protein [Paramagnetospirillum marisnigri]